MGVSTKALSKSPSVGGVLHPSEETLSWHAADSSAAVQRLVELHLAALREWSGVVFTLGSVALHLCGGV